MSSLIAMLFGINKKWRIKQNGQHNFFILIAIFIISFVAFGIASDSSTDSSSNAFLGLLGILTIPVFLYAKIKSESSKTNSVEQPDIERQNTKPVKINDKSPVAMRTNIERQLDLNKNSKGTALEVPKHIDINKSQAPDNPDWYVSISFGRSRSQSFPQALAMAKMAPSYIENDVEGNTLYQAVYSARANEYLSFIKLYELVSNWKSCFVIINGQLVDRKIIGGLNYCYGDKCRSSNPEFCYGASYMTENPFGCHRIQISACNHPWWTFGRLDNRGVWLVDKKAMLERMTSYSEPYRLCPAFSWERAVAGLNCLPDEINPRKDKNWYNEGGIVTPKEIEAHRPQIQELSKR